MQQQIIEALQALPSEVIRDPKRFLPLLEKTLKPLKLKKPVKDAVLKALTERDSAAKEMPASKGDGFEPDPELRDYENVPLRPSPPNPLSQAGRGGDGRSIYDEDVPLKQDIYDYFEREVKPYVGDAWIDEAYKDEQDQQTGIVGYTINFNRYFYKHEPPEPLEAIEAKIKQLETEILALLQGS